MKTLTRWLPRLVLASAFCVFLGGCVTAPAFDTLPSGTAPPAHRVAAEPQQWLDHPVVWGGMILEVRNFEHHSEIEMLGYPMDDKQRPLLELPDEGRFIALLPGYVEARSFPQGRFLSLIGRITGERRGSVRSQEYTWPEVDVDRVHLWPRDFRESGSRFSFGVGVGVNL